MDDPARLAERYPKEAWAAACQAARDAGDGPGLAEGWLEYQGTHYFHTARGQALAYEHARIGIDAYLKGQTGNAYTDFLVRHSRS